MTSFIIIRLHSFSRSTTPKTAAELRPQYEALCRILNLGPVSPATLATFRDPSLLPVTLLPRLTKSGSRTGRNGDTSTAPGSPMA